MKTPRYALLAARLLQRMANVVGPLGSPDTATRVVAIERALLDKQRRKRLRVGTAILGAAAALVAIWIVGPRWIVTRAAVLPNTRRISLVLHPRGRGAHVLDRGSQTLAKEGLAFSAGQRLLVEDHGAVDVSLSTGSELGIAERSSLEVREHGSTQRFFLAAGELQAKVEKLAQDQRFVVETPDAQIEVRGTRFRVKVSDPDTCAPDTRTRVAVQGGVVEVRSRGRIQRIAAGQEWPGPCSAELREPLANPPDEPKAAASQQERQRPARHPLPAQPELSSSNLSEQNRLFEQSLAARQRGDTERALESYDQLIGTYPNSALAENAIVDRMRLLRGTDPEGARREARRYLERYPNGFARSEAVRLLRGEP